jgi:hypothetical protein
MTSPVIEPALCLSQLRYRVRLLPEVSENFFCVCDKPCYCETLIVSLVVKIELGQNYEMITSLSSSSCLLTPELAPTLEHRAITQFLDIYTGVRTLLTGDQLVARPPHKHRAT